MAFNVLIGEWKILRYRFLRRMYINCAVKDNMFDVRFLIAVSSVV